MGVKRIKTGFVVFLFITSSLIWSMDGEAIDLFRLGERDIQRQDYYGAIDSLQEALRLNPAYLDAILALADAYFRIEEYEEAYQYVEMAALYGRNDIHLINMKARILIGREDLDGGEALFGEVLRKEPNNLDANLGLAEISLLRGDRENGVERYRKSLVLSPESRRALLSLALLFDLEELYAEAENYLELALSFHSRDPEVYISMAEHYLRTGDVERAAYFASSGTLLAPKMLGPYKLLGQSFMEQGKWLEAVDPLIQALSREPSNVTLLYMLSQCYINLSMDTAALKTLDKALRIDPYNEIVRITMEQFLINNPGTSVSQREKLGSYHYDKGQSYEKDFYFDRAFNEYRRGKWINPYDYEGWIRYGRVFNMQDFPGKYLDTMQAISESGYEDADFQETLMILEHKKEKGLDDNWGVDQFDLSGNPYNIALFPQYSANMVHTGSEQVLGDYLKFILLKHSSLNPILGNNTRVFSEAFSSARIEGSDYFIILDFSETERTFLCKAQLYLTSTGAKMGETTVMRTGKERIALAMEKLAVDLDSFFTPRSNLVDLNDEDALVGMGRFQNLEEGREALLLKKESVSLLSQDPWIDYNEEDLLGRVTIDFVDEEISHGIIERYSLFDLISPGDELYFLPMEENTSEDNDSDTKISGKEEEQKRMINSELKNQLLRLN